MALSARQRRFAEEYLIDLNATQAATRAGYSAKTADRQGPRLLGNVGVSALIQKLQADRATRTGITADRVLGELAKIAFADIRNVVTWRANGVGLVEDPDTGEQRIVTSNEVILVDAAELSDDAAAAIVEVSQTAQGSLKVKLHDKRAALVDLGRHLGLFTVDAKGKGGTSRVGKKEIADADARQVVDDGGEWGDDLRVTAPAGNA